MDAELNPHRSLRVLFVLTILIFFLAMGLGLIQSLSSAHQLPPINSHYTPEINALIENENYDEVIPHLERAISIDLENTAQNKTLLANVCKKAGHACIEAGDFKGALVQYEKAYAASPNADVCKFAAQACIKAGNFKGALVQYEKAYAASPNATDIQNNLAWFLATCRDGSLRDGPRAVKLGLQADKAKPGNASTLDTLAAAYAEAGDFKSAVSTQRQAIRLSPAPAQADFQNRLDLYLAGKPYRSP